LACRDESRPERLGCHEDGGIDLLRGRGRGRGRGGGRGRSRGRARARARARARGRTVASTTDSLLKMT